MCIHEQHASVCAQPGCEVGVERLRVAAGEFLCTHFPLTSNKIRFFCIDGAGKSKRGKVHSQFDEIKCVLATRKRPFTSLKNDADLTAIQEMENSLFFLGGGFGGLILKVWQQYTNKWKIIVVVYC